MSLYDDIKTGLEEAISYEKGNISGARAVKVTKIIEPVYDFSPLEIKNIRLHAGMTQSIFAQCIGVSKKSVESWENGRTSPEGAAKRMLGLLRDNPLFAQENGIIVMEM